MFDININREGGLMDGVYYRKSVTVIVGASDQLVDLLGALETAGRNQAIGPARYLVVETDVDITMRINDATLDEIPGVATAGVTIPLNVMAVSRLYFTHAGASSALGDATVTIFAA